MKRFLFLAIALMCAVSASSDTKNNAADVYVNTYSSLAVEEMYRSGIPASITLAQGLLESAYGKGSLAVQANNHFGIKCHSDWQGEHVFKDDDAKGECFRKYPAVIDSYKDHSDFLRFKPRYAFLFEYSITDYKSWAYGLSKAGYATDPKYAPKLIHIIETYNLSRFDTARPFVENQADAEAATALPPTPRQLEEPVRYEGEGRKGTYAVSLSREVLQVNGVPFVYAREGETYRSIATIYDLFPGELASFNDMKDVDRALNAGETVYLAHKASRAAKGLDKHICSSGETLMGLSQKYAVKLKRLMKLNGIKDPDMALPDDMTLYLREHRSR